MQNLITVIIGVVCGLSCGFYAYRNKKNPYLWFFIGLMCGVLGLLFLIFFPFKKKQTEPVLAQPVPYSYSGKLWHYLDPANTCLGPMSEQKLHDEFKKGIITSSTYLWNQEMDEWKTLEQLKLFNINSL